MVAVAEPDGLAKVAVRDVVPGVPPGVKVTPYTGPASEDPDSPNVPGPPEPVIVKLLPESAGTPLEPSLGNLSYKFTDREILTGATIFIVAGGRGAAYCPMYKEIALICSGLKVLRPPILPAFAGFGPPLLEQSPEKVVTVEPLYAVYRFFRQVNNAGLFAALM